MLLVVGLTSGVAVVAGRRSGAERRTISGGILRALELAGISTLFLIGNLAVGLAIVLGIRNVSSWFVSVYVLNDTSLVALSALQGAVFFCWRRGKVD